MENRKLEIHFSQWSQQKPVLFFWGQEGWMDGQKNQMHQPLCEKTKVLTDNETFSDTDIETSSDSKFFDTDAETFTW